MGVAGSLIAFRVHWPVWLVNFFAFTIAFWISYLGHRHFTFRTFGDPIKFLVASVVGLAMNNIFLALTYFLTQHDLVSITLAAAASPIAVFLISRLWVFNERP